MKLPTLIDATGGAIPLDRQLGTGGEGAVFSISGDSKRVVKLYHSAPSTATVEKLTAMIGLGTPSLMKVTTWPSGLVFDSRTRKPAGFLMHKLEQCQEIWRLYHPIERPRFFPRAGWTFQLRAAVNLAGAFDEVHKSGFVIGDVQLRNAHVTGQAKIWLVDCDSFQVSMNGKQFLCEVGQEHYIPPELQGKSLRGLTRTTNHDRFGLAVLIYQLLFVGRHPYMGLYGGQGDPSFQEIIAQYRFSQGPMAHTWGMSPPPHTPTFADIPQDLGMLFRRSFERGSERNARPSALEWHAALRNLERNVSECVVDSGHMSWNGAKGCVWCRLATNGGPEYYYGVSGTSGTFEVDEAKLKEVLSKIAAVGMPDFRYRRERFEPDSTPDPEPLPCDLDQHKTLAQVLRAATVLCVLAMPLGFIRVALFVMAMLCCLVFGVWLGVLTLNSPWRQEYNRRRSRMKRADFTLQDVEEEWDHCVRESSSSHKDIARRIHKYVEECRDLLRQYQSEIQGLASHAEGQARLRHLRLHMISDADIPGIGPTRKRTLASFGILSAANVEWDAIRGIKGFGDGLTQSVLAWRDTVLRAFRFDPLSAVSPADSRAVANRYNALQKEYLAKAAKALSKLALIEPQCRNTLLSLEPEIRTAVLEYEQAVADFRLVRGGR